MERNIILAGVGGQGILTIAYVLDNSAMDLGLNFKQAEVHGMAQRGGAVQSHLRISDGTIYSDLISEGSAHMVLSVEPLEALRYVRYLAPGGVIVTSSVPYVNIPDYMDLGELYGKLEALGRCVMIDSKTLARKAGSSRAENVVMIGAALPDIGFPEEVIERYVTKLFSRKGEKVVSANIAAFHHGLAAGRLFRKALDIGLTTRQARLLTSAIDPATMPIEAMDRWKELLVGPMAEPLEQALAAVGKPIQFTDELLVRLGSTQDPAAIPSLLG